MLYSLLSVIAIFSINLSESNSSGPESPAVAGHVVKVNVNKIDILRGKFLQNVNITSTTKVVYVIFMGAGEELKPGYPVKGQPPGATSTCSRLSPSA